MTELFSKLDGWDYLAVALLAASLWLVLGGVGRLQAANPKEVDAAKLKRYALGAALAAAAYLLCRYFS